MVLFVKLEPDGRGGFREIESRNIAPSAIQKCPHSILLSDHYLADETCKCSDPAAAEMAEWGYVWCDATKQWESP